ncbi:MAG: MarC family protein [Spirochaetales bacterium]|nr:MarC family protein [Spirochaetales bacterium]
MTLYSAVITLILIMDPFGNIPIFLSELDGIPSVRRRIIIIRESIFAFIILTFFLFFGRIILNGLHVSQPALSVSGGIILFLIAIKMIFPGKIGSTNGSKEKAEEGIDKTADEEPMFVPLAVPMLAGPSAIAFVILSSGQYPGHRLSLLAALAIASGVCTCILLLSEAIRKLLGNQAIRAIERLMGMILTTMSIQMLLTGLTDFFNL